MSGHQVIELCIHYGKYSHLAIGLFGVNLCAKDFFGYSCSSRVFPFTAYRELSGFAKGTLRDQNTPSACRKSFRKAPTIWERLEIGLQLEDALLAGSQSVNCLHDVYSYSECREEQQAGWNFLIMLEMKSFTPDLQWRPF